jgi:hypothetical protein
MLSYLNNIDKLCSLICGSVFLISGGFMVITGKMLNCKKELIAKNP